MEQHISIDTSIPYLINCGQNIEEKQETFHEKSSILIILLVILSLAFAAAAKMIFPNKNRRHC